jgi:predicted DNA-binding protein (MmcQ/YjbR family)
MQALRKLALGLPEAEEGTSCNKSAFRARGKAFAFMGSDDETYNVMVKLHDSLPQATALAKKDAASCRVGAGGWVTAVLPHDAPTPDFLPRWIDESYQLLVHKDLVALLAVASSPRKKAAKKRQSGKP